MQNYNPPSRPKKPAKNSSSDSFLEALRDLGSSATSSVTDGVKDFASDAWSQLSGNYPTDQSYPDFPNLPQASGRLRNPGRMFPSESENRYRKQAFYERQQRVNEKTLFSKTEQQTKLQIQAIQEEIKKLAASTQNLAKEVQVAALQTPVNPGRYHVNFFEKLRQTIILIKKRIEESASWLATYNGKSKKQDFYWSQVGKSGTKYMLSQERYMSNSAG